MAHAGEDHPSRGVGQEDVPRVPPELPYPALQLLRAGLDSWHHGQYLALVALVAELRLVDRVDDGPPGRLHVAHPLLRHVPDRLQLGRGALLEVPGAEPEHEVPRVLGGLDEGVGPQPILVLPAVDEGLEAEVAEHAHVSPVDRLLEEGKEPVLSLRERMVGISPAALPVEDHTVRVNFSDGFH